MTNTDTTAECMVCGATFAQDQNLFDYCATCIEHEKAHRSPSGCLEACRFCAVSDDDADAALLRMVNAPPAPWRNEDILAPSNRI